MGNRSKLRSIIFFVAAGLLAATSTAAQAACSATEVKLRGDFGQARFSVEVADSPAARGEGLMHRAYMAKSSGMLFIFEQPHPVAFWMKNTLIPLDMIFLDRTGTVARIHSNAIPHDETPIQGGDGIYAVLEINGGLANAMGLAAGNAMQHPAFKGGPATWPCE